MIISVDNDNIHSGHRSRVREKINSGALDNMHYHEILEYLLFHTVPYRDTNDLAHRLIEHFGSFHAVLEASYEDLLDVKGVSDVTATFLSSLSKVFARYSEDVVNNIKITSVEDIVKYVSVKYIGVDNEVVYLLCLDSNMNIKNCTMLAEGVAGKADIENRKVAEIALRDKAELVILIHNHPNKNVTPSSDDIETTYNLMKVLGGIGIKLVDHIIISGKDYFSMAKNEKLRYMFS